MTKPSPSGRPVQLMLRASEAEAEEWRAAADQLGLSLSTWMRMVILQSLKERNQPVTKKR
jgi:antitoxin component of RelBE/YafQ-DinJ toxin-antitoxin module